MIIALPQSVFIVSTNAQNSSVVLDPPSDARAEVSGDVMEFEIFAQEEVDAVFIGEYENVWLLEVTANEETYTAEVAIIDGGSTLLQRGAIVYLENTAWQLTVRLFRLCGQKKIKLGTLRCALTKRFTDKITTNVQSGLSAHVARFDDGPTQPLPGTPNEEEPSWKPIDWYYDSIRALITPGSSRAADELHYTLALHRARPIIYDFNNEDDALRINALCLFGLLKEFELSIDSYATYSGTIEVESFTYAQDNTACAAAAYGIETGVVIVGQYFIAAGIETAVVMDRGGLISGVEAAVSPYQAGMTAGIEVAVVASAT